jgi:hypothetical protein
MSKSGTFALLLTLILAMSCLTLLVAKSTNAQYSSPTAMPSTPDFTLAITNSSYYVPPTTNTSYYSGYVDALNITITIKNQPLALSVESNEFSGFKYWIEVKSHDSTNWTSLTWIQDGFGTYNTGLGFLPSNAQQTELTFQFSNPYFPVNGGKEHPANSSGLSYATNPFFPVTVAKDELLDFRVRAGIGDFSYLSMGQLVFNGNYSDWNQLTIIMADGETSASNPSPSPTVPEMSWLVILPLIISLFSVAVLLRTRKTAKLTQ